MAAARKPSFLSPLTLAGEGLAYSAPPCHESNTTGTITRSCAECRRRRIRCEGGQPCHQCNWYQVPHLCHYPLRKPRRTLSAKTISELSSVNEKSKKVLGLLFPNRQLDDLALLSREQLLEIIQQQPSQLSDRVDSAPGSTPDQAALEYLEPSPEQDLTWDEVSSEDNEVRRVTDDVNGMSLSLEKSRSFLGVSSVPTVLRVIAQVCPRARQGMGPETLLYNERLPKTQSTVMDESEYVDAYFNHVHGGIPMVDEMDFRECYAQGRAGSHHQGPWLALSNMVLSMGCIAASGADNNLHTVYYERASEHLNLRDLGSGNLYTVQALGILGGYYLHFVNRPNMATVLLGAALRMALSLGLHRIPLQNFDSSSTQVSQKQRWLDTRAKTWWSLFCLDTWASFSLGRPSLGRWSSDISVPTGTLSQTLDPVSISLLASKEFCRIGTDIQDRLARPPLMTSEEIKKFDGQLVHWYSTLSPILVDIDKCPPSLITPRGMLRSRYFTLRLTLYRPYLLTAALRRLTIDQLVEDEKHLVLLCRAIAQETIDTIVLDWFENQITGWNAVWHLFQASLIPVLSIISDPRNIDRPQWEASIEKALTLFQKMIPWGPGAQRSYDVIAFLKDLGASESSEGGNGVNDGDSSGDGYATFGVGGIGTGNGNNGFAQFDFSPSMEGNNFWDFLNLDFVDEEGRDWDPWIHFDIHDTHMQI